MKICKKELQNGFKDGIPIALGYFAVSFSFGIIAVKNGLSIFASTLTSLTNVTSAGQFAGLQIMAVSGTILELILTQIIINLRYALMSLSLSQKLTNMSIWKKMIIAFANTDEIFAVAIGHQKELTLTYMVGLQSLPIFGWTLGTLTGAIAGNILPNLIVSALSVALYAMFIAIVIPVAKKSKSVLFTVCIAIIISIAFYYIPVLNTVSTGLSIVISTIVASIIGAVVFPIKEEEQQ